MSRGVWPETGWLTSRGAMWGMAVLAVGLVYGRCLGFPFQFDDGHAIVDNTNLRSLAEIPRYFVDPRAFSVDPTLTMYRPLLLTGLAVNHWLSGLQPWSWHLGNVIVHAAVAIAVFEVATRLLGSRAHGCLAAALFALHPVHSEAVYYVSSRSESQAALFVLLALWLHLAGRSRWATVAEVAAFAAGLLTKSAAMALLPVLLLHDALLRGAGWRQRRGLYAALGAVVVGYLAVSSELVVRATLAAPVRGYDEQLWSQVKGLVYYLQLLFVPRALSVDHQFQLSASLADPYAASALALLISGLLLAAYARRRRPLLPFLVLWFGAALVPASIVPLNVIVNEHRLYLAGVAFAIGCAWLAANSPLRLRLGRGLYAAVLLLGVLSWQRGSAWASVEGLWQDAIHKGPTMARPRFMLGDEYLRQGRVADGVAMMEEGLQRDPHFAAGYATLIRAHADAGDWAAATGVAERAESRLGSDPSGWTTLAESARHQAITSGGAIDAWQRSAAAYRRAVHLRPEDADLRANLGNTYQELGQAQAALPHHQRAVALAPGNAEHHLNLGNSYLMLERWQEAEPEYRRALELAPDFAAGWQNLSVLFTRQGRLTEAAEALRRAQLAAGGGR